VTELRLAKAGDRDTADRVLAAFLPRFNRRFSVAALDPIPAWRPAPGRAAAERICCLKYRRVVANDHTIRAGASILQLPPRSDRRSYAGTRVELQLRLDGRMVVWDGQRELLSVAAPSELVQLRTLGAARSDLGTRPPIAGYRPAADHPWRRGPITRRTPEVTESPNR
jgi:hypothetical protein